MMPLRLFSERDALDPRVMLKLTRCRHVVLFLDYDGTLVPIQRTPAEAVLDPKTKAVLQLLADRPDVTLCIATGRAHADITGKVPPAIRLVIANHGFEVSMSGSVWVHPLARTLQPLLLELECGLRRELAPVKDLLIENKQYNLTIHYRNVDELAVDLVKAAVVRAVQPHAGLLKLTRGKKVLEVRPDIDWNKGLAAEWMLEYIPRPDGAVVFYLGDDRTDEDAFRVLGKKAVTVVVGEKAQTAALYAVGTPLDVTRFLTLVNRRPRRREFP